MHQEAFWRNPRSILKDVEFRASQLEHDRNEEDCFKLSPEYRNFDRIDGEPMDFEWNIFTGFNTLQLSDEVKSSLLRLGKTPENCTGRIKF